MTKQLATVPLIESDVQARDEQQLRQILAQQSVLGSGRTNVKRLGSEAGDIRLQGLLRPPLTSDKAELLATELAELSKSAKSQVPLFRRDDSRSPGRFERAGYYSVENATVQPAHPADQAVYQLDVSLSKAGARGNSYRAIRTNPQTIDHAWTDGSSTAEVLIPITATKQQWLNEQTGETEYTTPFSGQATTTDVVLDIRDLNDASVGTDAPTLIYDLGYQTDVYGVRVYDSRGADSRLSTDNIRQWQVIHSSEHDIDSETVLQNGAIRLFLTDGLSGTITAEEFTSIFGWDSIAIPDSTWFPLDIDFTSINQQRIAGQILFADSDDNATHPLNFKLAVGDQRVLFHTPESVSASVPSGLVDLLDPVAAGTDTDPQAQRTLIPKSEVRR